MKSLHISLILLLIILLASCRKETDNNHPIISIDSPAPYSSFQVFDTIFVRAKITDEKLVTNVKVSLTDSDFRPILSTYYYSPNTTSFNLEIDYQINDYYLDGGDYYLQVQATDGINSKNQYQPIEISGIPSVLNGIITINRSGSNAYNVVFIDQNDQQQQLFEFTGDYAASAINSRNNQLYIAGKQSINIEAYNLLENTLDWQLPLLINPPMHVDDCLHFNEYLFSTFRNDYIRGFHSDGSISFTADIEESALNKKIFRHYDLVLVDRQSKNNSPTYLVSYYLLSGVEKQKRQTNFEIVEFLSYTPDELFIICNTESEGQIFIYDPYLNKLTHLKSIQWKLYSVVQAEMGVLVLSAANQLLHYDFSTNQLSTILNINEDVRLLYERLDEEILVVDKFQVSTFSYPEFELLNTSTLADTIQNAHLYYNK